MTNKWKTAWKGIGLFLLRLLELSAAYLSIEALGAWILQPESFGWLWFGASWSLILASIALLLPRKGGKIFFGITYYFFLLWTLAQTGYCRMFSRMMWLTDVFYAGEGADYLGGVLGAFPVSWWIGGIVLIGMGVLLIWKFPQSSQQFWKRIPYSAATLTAILLLAFLPELVFLRDLGVWGTRSEYAQSSSYRATYNTMYDAKNVYQICGVYHLTFRDIWKHELYPLTPAYRAELEAQTEEVNTYFRQRGDHENNDMTGIFQDKNVVMVLMESMDDWMITPEDTPTLYRMRQEGINFTNFYTQCFIL